MSSANPCSCIPCNVLATWIKGSLSEIGREEMDCHIWNLYDFFTQVTDFDNSLQGGHETRNHMDHSKK